MDGVSGTEQMIKAKKRHNGKNIIAVRNEWSSGKCEAWGIDREDSKWWKGRAWDEVNSYVADEAYNG